MSETFADRVDIRSDSDKKPFTTVTPTHILIGQASGRGRHGAVGRGPHEGFGNGTHHEGSFGESSESSAGLPHIPTAFLTIGDNTVPGGLSVAGSNGRSAVSINGLSAALVVGMEGNAGELLVLDKEGDLRIRLDGTTGDVELVGADCAEEFDVAGPVCEAAPGMVMRISDGDAVQPSSMPYDTRVAGIVSGAGSLRAGIVLDKVRGTRRRVPLAVTGKAFCKVDAGFAAIGIGDLLTTSATLGHAMKAVDPARAFGSVIGKALRPLSSGKDIIPVLVALQ